jgi:probable F420-dependent oxidoreductase
MGGMPKVELGTIGAVLSPDNEGVFVETAIHLEDLGYGTIWLTGGPLDNLGQVADVVRATKHVRVATGIISVDRFSVDEVAALYTELEAAHPGRFVVGLGGAHGLKPMSTLTAYLERLSAVPQTARVLAALGPQMLDLARGYAASALAVLVTPEYTTEARARLGDSTTLAIEQVVVVETDPERARATARGPLGFLGQVPAYQANFRRMGFHDDEIAQLADRLVDSLVWWGDADAIAARVPQHLQAGADHLAISVTPVTPQDQSLDQWARLAERLLRV